MSRLSDLVRLYALLDRLQQRLGRTRTLATFDRFRDWPERDVYFFFEPTETRQESGTGPRVVRVGTHAGARIALDASSAPRTASRRQHWSRQPSGVDLPLADRSGVSGTRRSTSVPFMGCEERCRAGVRGVGNRPTDAYRSRSASRTGCASTLRPCHSCGSTLTTSLVLIASDALSKAMQSRCSAIMSARRLIPRHRSGSAFSSDRYRAWLGPLEPATRRGDTRSDPSRRLRKLGRGGWERQMITFVGDDLSYLDWVGAHPRRVSPKRPAFA